MPQVDLVSACAGGSNDRKIACETLADNNNPTEEMDRQERNPDSPPESFWLSKDQEFDWWDRNAVYERNESTKGNSSSNSTNLNPAGSNNNSQRFSSNFKSKASIIGLPKPQKPTFVDAKHRRTTKPSNTGLFPRHSASVGRTESSLVEPSSPKVSCMGRVRSKRDRNRRLRNRQRSTSESATATAKEKSARSGRRKPGFFESFRAIFWSSRREKPVQKSDLPPSEYAPMSKNVAAKLRHDTAKDTDASFAEPIRRNSALESEPPGLGGVKRFASGRRSESWIGDSEIRVPQ
ncbi:hypothetical protein L6164_033856 [Bauhinia variegata]|uniref:Uncharacterized protein n=1 Tax=Bauhinia variegata TaxID=167791 RepID=A0ACB9KTF2_BAUVA|nr:hypothetical protein L6164_033856 [Bauhinia variegata]